MTEREFQREADTYRMHLLLSFRSESMKLRGSALIQSADQGIKVDADSILQRTSTLDEATMVKEIQIMLDGQIKQYFRALQVTRGRAAVSIMCCF